MKKPTIFKNNCFVEIIPVIHIQDFWFNRSKVILKMKKGRESFKMSAVAASVKPSCTNQQTNAGDTFQVALAFRIAYVNAETTNLLQNLKGYGSLLVTYYSSGREHIVLGTVDYPVFLNYSMPSSFDGYEINLTGTQDIPPLIMED